ncbi:hypothetical protein VPEG_00079 [Vibrio phage SIO-2]|uniref:hypothetical protein n=1 Tax=Vibrio phage SIO-2 TaxID=700512 RepID=UPI0002357C74|nr:hypothetical protein VPEG_00079 [Vibrio phage SIO-2]AET42229.1 hypothetical protein VPEG_00079 [Vibrio phage SIO-2]QKE60724.1 hypothetical protein vBVhaSVHB1_37 [Vibrio phage vB_VhaS-VHB1]
MGVQIKLKSKKANKAPTVTHRPEPRVRVQVTQEQVDEQGDRREEILRDTEQPINIPDSEFTQPVANVGFQCSMTKNLGDFNSLKVGVSVHIPCYTHEIDPTFDLAKKFVETKLNETMEEYSEDLQGGVTSDDLASFDQ